MPPAATPPAPLRKPAHFTPPSRSRWAWLARRPAGVAAAGLGFVAFVVVAVAQPRMWATPDWHISVPGAAVTAIAAAISIARREHGAHPLWLLGLGLAGASIVLGWFLLFAIVVAVTAALILILHAVM